MSDDAGTTIVRDRSVRPVGAWNRSDLARTHGPNQGTAVDDGKPLVVMPVNVILDKLVERERRRDGDRVGGHEGTDWLARQHLPREELRV